MASPTRGVIAGGNTPSYVTTMDYITIATEGSAVDFGNLTNPTAFNSATSNAHGGL